MDQTGGSEATGRRRVAAIDLLRGIAIGLMVLYHGAWDLTSFGLARFDLYGGSFWLFARWLIIVLFLLLVGFSLVLAHGGGIRWRPFARRLAFVIAGALAITLGTYVAFPTVFVFFGVLHAIAACSLLGLAFLRRPGWLVAAVAAAALAAPHLVADPIFDTPGLWWVGLSPVPPPSVDYVPLLPWFGWVLAGMLAARWFTALPLWSVIAGWGPRGGAACLVAWAGRHGLVIYLLHQPLLFGLAYAVAVMIGGGAHGG